MSSARMVTPMKNLMTQIVRRGYHAEGGIPGSNLPFQIKNRYRLTLGFIVFFGSAFGLPFILVRHQLLKK